MVDRVSLSFTDNIS